MIGILLALQVNNWNEWRKDRKIEKQLLFDLKRDLESNLNRIESDVQLLQNINRVNKIVLSSIEQKLPYSDSLDVHFGIPLWLIDFKYRFKNVGYDGLINSGLDLIESDSLKKEIVGLFAGTYGETLEFVNDININEYQLRQYMANNFHNYFCKTCMDSEMIRYRPINPIKTMSDNYFRSVLFELINHAEGHIEILNAVQSESKRVLQLIMVELGDE